MQRQVKSSKQEMDGSVEVDSDVKTSVWSGWSEVCKLKPDPIGKSEKNAVMKGSLYIYIIICFSLFLHSCKYQKQYCTTGKVFMPKR